MDIDNKQYPLTTKWIKAIRKVSFVRKLEFDQVLQDCMILEWKLPKILGYMYNDESHRENYFTKSVFQYIPLRLLRERKYFFKNSPVCRRVYSKRKDDTSMTSFFDSIVAYRSFDSIFYDHLITHVCSFLNEEEGIIFRMRIENRLKWYEIFNLEQFQGISTRMSKKIVKKIKKIVSDVLRDNQHVGGFDCLQPV